MFHAGSWLISGKYASTLRTLKQTDLTGVEHTMNKETVYGVFGAGRQGIAAAYDLKKSGARILLADSDEGHLLEAGRRLQIDSDDLHVISFHDRNECRKILSMADAVVFAADYSLNLSLTELAIEEHCHAVDFGGNHDVVSAQHELDSKAREAGVSIVPDTGLTPGLAGILVAGGIKQLDSAERASIRVGGLPVHPEPPLNYALLFSVRGLTNEYLEPSVVMHGGKVQTRPSLSELETLEFRDETYEAFLTSGGVSTLPVSFAGQISELDCKTIRYPGHAEFIRFAFDLGFSSENPVKINGTTFIPRQVLETMLVHSLPHDTPDKTLLRVAVEGVKDGEPAEVVYEMEDYYSPELDFTSMQKCTAWPSTIILQMITGRQINKRGVLYQELEVSCSVLIEELGKRGIKINLDIHQPE